MKDQFVPFSNSNSVDDKFEPFMSTKRTFQIPVVWTMSGVMLVEADDLDEAIRSADENPLPMNGDYLEGSFEVQHEAVHLYN
jgi:hypothetical protein